jgi:ABC-type glycerol-3-phosphate transport system permease component
MRLVRTVSMRVLLYLILALVAVYTLVPTVTMILTAFRDEADLQQGPFTFPRQFAVTANFIKAWTQGHFSIYLKNSIIQAIPSVMIVILFATLAGFSFAKMRFPLRNAMFFAMLGGMMIPFQSIMIPMYFLFNSLGLIDTHWAVVIALGVGGIPFGTFMMRSFFMGLPNQLLEAARLDGCSDFSAFLRVMLPLTYPAWVSLIIFQSMWSWNAFLVPLVFIFTDSMRPLPLGLMFFSSRYNTDYTLVAAGVLITIAPLIVLYIFLQRKFISSITMGALTG